MALRKVQGRVGSVETFGTVDGPGIRYVLFLQGCPLRCLYCHNPEIAFCAGGDIVGAGEAVAEILRYSSYIRNGGVTFSGGEPLLQTDFVRACCLLLREAGLHTAIDTSGSEPLQRAGAALEAADLILLDLKAHSPELCLRLTGRDNRAAFATLDYLEELTKPVWIRHVLLEGYTLQEAELRGLARKLSRYSCVEKVELLPFHKLGEAKWSKCGLPYELAGVPATTKEQVLWAGNFFREHGLPVQ